MKTNTNFFAATLLLASAGSALTEVHYVDIGSTNATPPYTNWATAATNIQDAVDAATAGDEVVVTNGVYSTGGRAAGGDSAMTRLVVDKPLSVRSVNGSQFTTIAGGRGIRCAYLTNNASLSGFTLTGGRALFGGGVFCSSNAVVSDSAITGNSVGSVQPGQVMGGGAYVGTLNNCTLSGNSANVTYAFPFQGEAEADGGGAAYCAMNNLRRRRKCWRNRRVRRLSWRSTCSYPGRRNMRRNHARTQLNRQRTGPQPKPSCRPRCSYAACN
jgi:hypothetical protein